jgi:hypothetical protein
VSDSYQGTGLSLGIHGWRGCWLVNGSFAGIVTMDLDPTQRAKVAGLSVRMSQMRVSVQSPNELIACLAP